MINYDFMQIALDTAQTSQNDLPVGAVMVKDGKIIAKACNQKERTNQVYAHAEMLVIEETCKKLNNWRLEDCELYVTLEPCPMCAWAIVQSRIKKLYFGSYDNLYGAFGSKIDARSLINSKIQVYGGIMEDKCNIILKKYLERMRKNDN